MTARFKNSESVSFDETRLVRGMYRPFCAQNVYFGGELNERPGQNAKLSPPSSAPTSVQRTSSSHSQAAITRHVS